MKTKESVVDDRFFDEHQRATILSAMARIIPTDHEPGAREAGTIDFLDRYLSGIGFIYAKPDGSGFETLQGRRAEAWRTRIEQLRGIYRDGIADLDRRSQAAHGQDFAALAPEQQDRILAAAERAEPDPPDGQDAATTAPAYALTVGPDTGGGEPALQQTSTETDLPFVPLLVLHTRQGFYADPIYGGNRGQVGWRVIGFPGPASLEDVFTGRYSTIEWFAEGHNRPFREDEHG
jgi:gluconate 2-dehydrogenase gamma chain